MSAYMTILYGLTKPSRKKFVIVKDKVKKPKVQQFEYLFDSYTADINSIDDIHAIIDGLKDQDNAFIIRGKGLTPEQSRIQRTKKNEFKDGTFNEHPTQWVCFDFDAVEAVNMQQNTVDALDWLIKRKLPTMFWNVSYCYQFSSSAGLFYNNEPIKPGTNAHIFFYLDRAVTDKELHAWFKGEIENGDVDRAVFRTVQPIFVSCTVDKPDAIIDTLAQRVGLVQRDKSIVEVPEIKGVKIWSAFVPRKHNEDYADFGLNFLNAIGCIYRDGGETLNLQSPKEQSVGGWYVYKKNPETVYHNSHKPMSIEQWLLQHFGLRVNMRAEYDLQKTLKAIEELEAQKEMLKESV